MIYKEKYMFKLLSVINNFIFLGEKTQKDQKKKKIIK